MNFGPFNLTPSAKVEDTTDRVDIKYLVAVLRRRARLFAAVAAVVFAATVLFIFQQTPLYSATAQVLMDTRAHDVTNIQEVLSGPGSDSASVDTEVVTMKSRALAERVVGALKLDSDPEFNGTLRPADPIASFIGAPMAALQGLFSSARQNNSVSSNAAAIRQARIHDSVVDSVLGGLSVNRYALTYVINVSYQSKDPEKAAAIANSFADHYLTQQLDAKYEATQQATGWLNERLSELEPQVSQAEAAVQQYKASHGLLAAVGSTLTEQEISQLNSQLAQAQADEAEQDARLHTAQQQLAAGSTGEDVGEAMNSDVIKGLRAQRSQLSSQAADMETKYGPKHPDVQRVQRQLADVDVQIKQEIGRIISSLQAQADVAHNRTASLQASLGQAKGTLAGNNASSVELADLQRKADAVSTLYDNLLTRAKETTTDQGAQQSDARVLSRAKIPGSPSSPKKNMGLLLGLILGVAAGGGAAFLAEMFDSGLATSEDVERALGVPHLGAVPRLDSTIDGKAPGVDLERYVVDKPLSAFAEAFRSLRASILFSKIDKPVKVVLLTSALPGEGKTTTAFCLGRSIAMTGSSVVVVDCDLRRRNINRLLNVEPEVGLVEVLQGSASLEDALVHDAVSGAYFLPLAKSAHTPRDLFGSAAMDRLIASLRGRFDLVLLDSAPVIPVSDTRILAKKADAVVFLVHWHKTPRKAVQTGFNLLASVGVEVTGVALTMVDTREQAKYGYGDAGYYYHSYRKYYTQ